MLYFDELENSEFLKKVSKEGLAWVHGNGFEWLRDTLLPALEAAGDSAPDEKALIAECFYVLGDVHDVNGAPKAAIEAYQKAIDYYEKFPAAYREMAGMYQNMGDYDNAAALISAAVGLDPEDELALLDQEGISEGRKNLAEPLYQPADKIWQANELLAILKPDAALAMLKGQEDAEAGKARARGYGALFDNDNYIKEWEKIALLSSDIELQPADWFYMPEEVYDAPGIWHIFLKLLERLKPGVFVSFESLDAAATGLAPEEQHRLVIEFNICRNEKNLEGLKQLQARYPAWAELKDEIDLLSEPNNGS